jgi:hypothetical protein
MSKTEEVKESGSGRTDSIDELYEVVKESKAGRTDSIDQLFENMKRSSQIPQQLPRLEISAKVYKRQNNLPRSSSSQIVVNQRRSLPYTAEKDKVDCGSYECYQELRMESSCIIYLKTNHSQCNIPCVMNGCKTEIHHFIMCPIWICDEKITTSTTTSSTTTTHTASTTTFIPPTPQPNPRHCEMSVWMYTSIIVNIFFFAIIAALLVYKCKKFWYNRATHQALDGNRFFSNNGRDDDDERNLLLSNETNQEQQQEQPQQNEQPLVQPQQHEVQVHQPDWDNVELVVPNDNEAAGEAAIEAATTLNGVTNQSFEDKKEPVFLLMKAINKFKKN